MNQKKLSIKKNYVLNTSYQVFTLITPLITAPYISRVLSANGVGIYSYTSSIVAFFSLFACLGTVTYGQRAIAQCRDDDHQRSITFWEIELLSIFTTIICSIVWLLFIVFFPEYKLYFIILSVDLISTAFDISWLYSGLEQFQYIVFRNMAVKLSGVILVFLFVRTGNDLWIYIAILSITKFIGNILMWFPLLKLVNRVSIKLLDIKPHFKETVAYFIPTAAASVYTYLDKIMIGTFTDSSFENGYYEQGNKIIKIAYTIIVSLNTVMSSRMSYLFAHASELEIKRKLEIAFAFIMTLGIPLVFGIAGISENFVPWFFGKGYDKVIILMKLASPLVVIMSLHNYLSAQYLVPSGQRVRSTKGVLTGAAVNFILNLILIPQFQSIGALIATLVAESSICVVYFYMSKEYIPIKLMLRYLPKQLVAGVIMMIAVVLIGRNHSGSVLTSFIQILVGGAIYGSVLIILKEKFLMNILKQILKEFNVKK